MGGLELFIFLNFGTLFRIMCWSCLYLQKLGLTSMKNIHETDRQFMCCKILTFFSRLITEMNDEHVLKGALMVLNSDLINTENFRLLQQ